MLTELLKAIASPRTLNKFLMLTGLLWTPLGRRCRSMTAPSLSPVSGTRVTVQELRDSIRKLARGKASDSSGVHAALLHALVHDDPRTQGPLFHMHRLVCEYWSDRPLSHELWKKSVLVPIF